MFKSTKKHGFSLIEAIMAIAILSIGILAVLQLFPLSLKISRSAEQETVAANLAQAKIEEMYSLGYDDIPVGIIEAKERLASDPANPFYGYQRAASSTYVDASLNPTATNTGMKKIMVAVYYFAPASKQESSLPFSIIISQK